MLRMSFVLNVLKRKVDMNYIKLSEGGEIRPGHGGLSRERGPEAVMPKGEVTTAPPPMVVIGVDLEPRRDVSVTTSPCPACYTSRARCGCKICGGSRVVISHG